MTRLQRPPIDRHTALSTAKFGRGSAERDDLLADVFVETDLWRRFHADDIDVVLGSKGLGKSAIYAQIFHEATALRHRRIVLAGAENPADDPIIGGLTRTGELSVREFVGLWKLYFLALSVTKLREMRIRDRTLAAITARLQQEQLLPEPGQSTMVDLFNRALRYVDMQFRLKADVRTPPAGMEVSGTITLHEPTADQPRSDTITVHRLLLQLGSVLARKRLTVWILIDRLDIAFVRVGEELESVALRALLQTYIDLSSRQYRLSLKLFLRDDVWPRINAVAHPPMPGGDLIEPSRLEWSDDRLLDLFCRRIAHNPDLCRLLDVSAHGVERGGQMQRDLAARLLPDVPAWSFAALLDRLRDGAGNVAPRELIRLMSQARSIQMQRLEVKNASYRGDELFEEAALESALLEVSNSRLYQVMCAEYPHLDPLVRLLTGGDGDLSLTTLARLWGVAGEEAGRIATQLTRLGFFSSIANGRYRIAPLYRPALDIREDRAPAAVR